MEIVLFGTYSKEQKTRKVPWKVVDGSFLVCLATQFVHFSAIDVHYQPFRIPLDVVALLGREFCGTLQPLGQLQATGVLVHGHVVQPAQILFHNLVLVLGIGELMGRRLVVAVVRPVRPMRLVPTTVYLIQWIHLHHSHVIILIIHRVFLARAKNRVKFSSHRKANH